MGKIDAIVKDYMSDSEVFADAFNQYLFKGERIIDPGRLKPLDAEEIIVPYGTKGAGVPVQRERDALKALVAKEDENVIYLLLGGEYQSEIHYAMPVKNQLYDAIQYARQVEKAAASYRGKNTDAGKVTSGEFLSGFHKEDKLIPVITLTIYFGAGEWDAPKSLRDMLPKLPENILQFVQDYRINLIAPSETPDEEIDRFHTHLREVLKYIKYSVDDEKLEKMVQEDAAYKAVDKKTARMIKAVTGDDLDVELQGEVVDVCKAHEEMKRKAAEKAAKKTEISIAERMLKAQKYNAAEIAEMTGLQMDEVEKIEGQLFAMA